MRKWKNGDRVRIIKNDAGSFNEIGDIGIVSAIHTYHKKNDLGHYGHFTVKVKGRRDNSWGIESYFDDVEYMPQTINAKIRIL